jgi:hypothetical protein
LPALLCCAVFVVVSVRRCVVLPGSVSVLFVRSVVASAEFDGGGGHGCFDAGD